MFCYRLFVFMSGIISKLLSATIWTWICSAGIWADALSSIGHRFASGYAALHKTRFATSQIVPVPFLNSETNEWSKDWAKWWAASSAALVCRSSRHIHYFLWKRKSFVTAWNYRPLIPFWLSNRVSIAKVVGRFPQASQSRAAATAAD